MKYSIKGYMEFVKGFYKDMSKPRRILFTLLCICLSFYISAVTFLAYSEIHVASLLLFFIYAFVFFNLLVFFCHKLKNKYIKVNAEKSKLNKRTFFFCSLICFVILFVTFLAYFPGGISPDNVSQWKQIQSFEFDNWHPVFHTFLMYLTTRIVNSYPFVIFVQIVFFSIAMAYLLSTLESWGFSKKVLMTVELFVVLNPLVRNLLMYGWKDAALTIFLMFLFSFVTNIYFTDGLWLSRMRNVVLLSVLTAFATLVRHNAFFYTLPLVLFIVLFYFKKSKKAIFLPAAVLAIYFLVVGPFYNMLNVTKPDNVFSESVGIPMTIMGDVMKKNKDVLPEKTRNFLLDIAPAEKWEEVYECGNYNSIKFESMHQEVIDNISVREFFEMTLDTIKRDPENSFLAVRELTGFVWKVSGEGARINVVTNGEEIGYTYKNTFINRFCMFFVRIVDMAINIPVMETIFALFGVQMLVLMMVGLFSIQRNGAKTLMFVIPNLAYNLGTMLLLCGKDYRFFHFNLVLTTSACLVMLARQADVIKD